MEMRTLRRFRGSDQSKCPGKYGYHNASTGIIEIVDATFARSVAGAGSGERYDRRITGELPDFRDERWVHLGAEGWSIPHDSALWPTSCDYCDYEFVAEDQWQENGDLLYRRNDIQPTMEQPDIMRLREAPAGAMWYAWWLSGWRHQTGDFPIVVRCPDGHEWMPDMEASNCTKPGDRGHYCWVLHGTAPGLTADKAGVTCGAGAGSIQTGHWHGFLRNGYLVQA